MNDEQRRWCSKYCFKLMKDKIGFPFLVTRYKISNNGNGVWFQDAYGLHQMYRKFPPHLREKK